MRSSSKLTNLVKTLCDKHGIEWQKERNYLHLQMTESEQYLGVENLGKERVSIGLYFTCEGHSVPEIEIVLWSGYQPEPPKEEEYATNWAAIEEVILYEGSSQYVELNENGEVKYCSDPLGQSQLSRFADDWSDELLANGWLERGAAVAVLPEQSHKRIPGCQSTNHTACYGELWQCTSCGKTVCYAEGTDNLPEFCDDCWIKAQSPKVESPRQIVSGTRYVTTIVNEKPQHSHAMQQVIEQIAAKHEVDLDYYLAFLWLDKPDCDQRLIIERIDDWNISIALAGDDDGSGRFILDPDMIFLTVESGWIPVEVSCSQVEWAIYLASHPSNGHANPDTITTDEYIAFTDHIAKRIRENGWLNEGIPQAEPPWEVEDGGRRPSVFRPHHENVVDSGAEDDDIPF